MITKAQKKSQKKYVASHKPQTAAANLVWRRSFEGHIKTRYYGMRQRVRGNTGLLERYEGLPIMPREDFVTWAEHDATYKELFDNWVVSGYKRPLVPTVDRVDDKSLAEGGLGYVLGNVEWLPLIENTNNGVQHGKTRRNASEGILIGSLPSNWKERMMFNRDEWFLWFPSKSHLAARFEYDLAKQILTNNQYRIYFLREILQLRETEIAKLLHVSQPCVSAALGRIAKRGV